MRKISTLIGTVAVAGFIASVWNGWAQGKHPTREFMRQKLFYTQGIVEWLVTEKYALVITNATALCSMNLTNAFFQLGNPDYLENIKKFQAKVDGLVNAANAKDLKNSTEQYSEVVNSCVACHKTFRREQFISGQ